MTLDTICDREARTINFDVPQGAALGAASAAAAWGSNVTIVTVLGSDYPQRTIDLLMRHGVKIHDGPAGGDSLRFWILRETDGIVMQYPHTMTPIEESTPLASVYRKSMEGGQYDYVHLCPMPLSEQIAWAESLRESVSTISVDPQPFSYAPPDSHPENGFKRLLQAVTILSISPNRFPHLMSCPLSALESLLALGPDVVALKMGANGSLVGAGADEYIHEVPPFPVTVLDDTGAGDAYAGSFVAGFAADRDVQKSAIRAAATSAVMIERIGMTHLLDEKDRVVDVYRDFRSNGVRHYRRPGGHHHQDRAVAR